MLILNIGLESRSDNGKDKTARESLRLAAIYQHFHGKASLYLQHSNTEPTVVVVCDTLSGSLADIAPMFQQDCIAVYNTESKTGALCGPHRGRWPFLREFFVLPCGRRLADVTYL